MNEKVLDWKRKVREFFRPTKWKIIVFLIFLIPLFFALIGSDLAEIVYPLLGLPILLSAPFDRAICGGFDCTFISTALSNMVFSLVYIMEVYLLLCLLFYLYNKIKTKRK